MKAWRKAARHFNKLAGEKHQGRKNKLNPTSFVVIPSNLFRAIMKNLEIVKIEKKKERSGKSVTERGRS